MKREITDSDLICYIDGELPPTGARIIEQAIAEQPVLRDRLESLRNLRVISRDVIRRSTPPVPEELAARIAAISKEFVSAAQDSSPARGVDQLSDRSRPAKPGGFLGLRISAGRGLALAAAATLVLALAAWLVANGSGGGRVLTGLEPAGMTSQTVSLLEARHLKCVMMGNNFADVSFPKVLKDVGPAVRAFLNDDVAAPDLSDVGLEFVGVGPCDMPGGKTLHWLYKSTSQPSVFVSLFVQPYSQQVPFSPDTAVVVAGPTAKHPLLVWRSETLVFYLIGDDFGATSTVAARMGQTFGG